jgi:hypothetical protein
VYVKSEMFVGTGGWGLGVGASARRRVGASARQ